MFCMAFLLGGLFRLGVEEDKTASMLGLRFDFEWRNEERLDTAAMTERMNEGFLVLPADEEDEDEVVDDVVEGVVGDDSMVGCSGDGGGLADKDLTLGGRAGVGVSGAWLVTSGESKCEGIGGDCLNE